MIQPLPIHEATRYVAPLREGGSLPAVVETETAGLWVVKFRGAGQGARALVAELIVGLIGRALGLPVPELALISLDPTFEKASRDEEIRDLLRASAGLNVGLRYLEGAFNFELLSGADLVSPELAAETVWLDALVSNIDRSPRNPNLMIWQREPWLIDHGAALYFHHDWARVDAARARQPFAPIGDHVLLGLAGDLAEADRRLSARLDRALLESVVAALPDALLSPLADPPGVQPAFESAEANRAAYLDYLSARLESPRAFVADAIERQAAAASRPAQALSHRR
jgi:hypothetical protein